MLKTEMRNENTKNIDKMSTMEMLKVIDAENYNAVKAVSNALESIEKAVDAITLSFKNGGRLFYIGAGTSGRLGVLDASECPPTYGVSDNTVIGIIAGGDGALRKAVEGSEDNPLGGINQLKEYEFNKNDVLVGTSAAGGAMYVTNAIEYAKSLGCVTIGITSNEGSVLDKISNISIVTDTGAEVVTGSTRMKAGTAQKLVLNMLSTCSMIKMGYVYENLMINLKATNIKLTKRMTGIVCDILECTEDTATEILNQSDWDIKKAIEIYKNRKAETL